MPVSTDGILEAVFDPAWAAVRLVVDGGMWPAPVSVIDVTRQVSGQAAEPVRGLERRAVVGGTYVGTDHEMPLESSVTYSVTGYDGDGLAVATASVTVGTAGAAEGMWVKVAGKPDLTVRVPIRELGDMASPTIGAVYTIAGGGGAVAQTAAHWSGVEAERGSIILAPAVGVELVRLRAALAASRILLLQPIGTSDLDAGWYFVNGVVRTNPAQVEQFPRRWVTLDVQRTGVPAGEGAGIAGTTWAGLASQCETWADVLASYDTWFDVLRGA